MRWDLNTPAASPDIVDVENYPSPEAVTSNVAQRLAADPWLGDDDIVSYTDWIAQQLHGQPGAEMLSFADPQQVQLLAAGDQRQREGVLRRLAGADAPPLLFLPVNHANSHWSLLVVNLHSKQAFHYDSMVPPEMADLATDTSQFGVARQVASALGVQEPIGMPITRQPDTHSCGDHVLNGIEALANRAITGDLFRSGGMDLSALRPQRDQVVAVLTHSEQFNAGA